MLPGKIVILGYPRSGSKLLADVLTQQGYFNFGEFFETYSTEIVDEETIPRAIRMSPHIQYEIFERFNTNMNEEIHIHSILTSERINKFEKYKEKELSSVTVFGHTIELYPELINILEDRFFLCIRRSNIFDQLLSRAITYYYKNYDGEIESSRIKLDANQFERFFFQLKKIERIQDFIINSRRGRLVDFDKLTTGIEDLGFNYKVTTNDQHIDLKSLVKNIGEITSKFNYLNSKY